MKNKFLNELFSTKFNSEKLNFKNITNYSSLLFLSALYLFFAFLLIFTNKTEIIFYYLEADTYRGVIAQLQIIILLYLTFKMGKTGFLTALILNIFSFSSLTASMLINSNANFLPGFFAYLTAVIVIVYIYHYQQQINLKIDELEKEKKKMKYMAYYDNLTEMANREMLINRLDYLCSMPAEEKINYSLIFIDFNNFKKVNDFWGYEIGDYLLKECAERLYKTINENDLAGRLGGDEFAVIVQRELEQKELEKYIRKIKRELEKPYRLKNRKINLNTNLGIAKFPEDGKNSKEIIKSADIAMYKAKSHLEREIEYFSKDMEKDVIEDVQMEDALKQAVINEEFHLLFQPQYNTNAKSIRGFEALIRWHSPEMGTVSPGRFIPVAEESALIREIGEWVIKTSISKFNKIKDNFKEEVILSINISVVQLTDPLFVDRVKKIINNFKKPGYKLEFEITESLFISDQEQVIDVLYKLKELDISIAMDDFGTGYASLSYLNHIPLDILKIDKVFIDMISYAEIGDKMMIPPIIEMAHQWGIKVVAEGVETVEQLHYLEDHHCDYLQGFLLNKPLSEYQINKSF